MTYAIAISPDSLSTDILRSIQADAACTGDDAQVADCERAAAGDRAAAERVVDAATDSDHSVYVRADATYDIRRPGTSAWATCVAGSDVPDELRRANQVSPGHIAVRA